MLLGLFIVSATFVNLLLSSITFHPNETEDEALLIGILEDTGILLLLVMFTELTILPTLFLLFLFLDEEENTGSKRWTLAFSRIALVDLKMKSLLLSCLGILPPEHYRVLLGANRSNTVQMLNKRKNYKISKSGKMVGLE